MGIDISIDTADITFPAATADKNPLHDAARLLHDNHWLDDAAWIDFHNSDLDPAAVLADALIDEFNSSAWAVDHHSNGATTIRIADGSRKAGEASDAFALLTQAGATGTIDYWPEDSDDLETYDIATGEYETTADEFDHDEDDLDDQ